MRTTLTIDDDLAALLKQRARELDLPFKDVVNRMLRAGFGEAARRRKPLRTPSGSGRGSISTCSINSSTNSKPRPTRRASGPEPGCERVRGTIMPDDNVLFPAHNAGLRWVNPARNK